MTRRTTATTTGSTLPRTASVALLAVVVVASTGGLLAQQSGPADGPFGPPDADDRPESDVTVEDVAVVDGRTVVTYAVRGGATETFAVADVDPRMVDAEADWAYLPRSALPPPLRRAVGDYDAGVGAVGPWALVGDLAAATATSGNARVTVVAPAGVHVDPGRKARFLARFVGPYSLRPGPETPVTLYVAPETLSAEGLMFDGTGYVTQHGFWDGEASSVWVHEYVHAQRSFGLAPSMRWFTEASATYLSSRVLAAQFRGVTEADFRGWLASRPEHDVALADRSAWAGSGADYDRGARLLYVLDAELRADSDGEHTLVDVVRAMNRRGGEITLGQFVSIVERYTGEAEPWLRRAITTPVDLDPRVQQAGDAFEDVDAGLSAPPGAVRGPPGATGATASG
jgi:hypothetical protein